MSIKMASRSSDEYNRVMRTYTELILLLCRDYTEKRNAMIKVRKLGIVDSDEKSILRNGDISRERDTSEEEDLQVAVAQLYGCQLPLKSKEEDRVPVADQAVPVDLVNKFGKRDTLLV